MKNNNNNNNYYSFFSDTIQDTSYTKTTTIQRNVIRSIFQRRGTAKKKVL